MHVLSNEHMPATSASSSIATKNSQRPHAIPDSAVPASGTARSVVTAQCIAVCQWYEY